METYMREQMSEEILRKAADLFQFKRDSISFLGGFENLVYLVQQPKQDYILRFVHSNHRSYHEVLAEIEFIDYLAHNGASVSTVIPSTNNHIVERISINDSNYFSAAVFEKAPGTYVQQHEKTPEFWEMFGTEVGRLHRLTKTFTPQHKRRQWHQEQIEDMADHCLEDDDAQIIDVYKTLKQRMMSFPNHIDNYGLIHTDLHFHNMYYHNNQLTFFDFDDSTYMHFVNDIAIVIYYSFQHLVVRENPISKEKLSKQVLAILIPFMKGYNKEHTIAKEEFYHLNDFLRYRATLLYIVLVNSGFKHHQEEGYRRFCNNQKEIALHHLMALDLDYLLAGLQ